MAHPALKWPKIETAKSINIEDSNKLCSWFINGDSKSSNKSRSFKVSYYNPKELIFQHMSVKVNLFNDGKNRYEEINRFRNGDKTQYLTSVDIEKVDRSGRNIVKIVEGFICDTLDFNPLEQFIIDKTKKEIISRILNKTKRYYKH